MSFTQQQNPPISASEIKEIIELLRELKDEMSKSLPECPDEMVRWSDVEKMIGTSYYKAVELSEGLCSPQRPMWSGEQKCGKCAKDGVVYLLKVLCLGLKGCFLVGEPVKTSVEAATDLLISVASYGLKIAPKLYKNRMPELVFILQSLENIQPTPPNEDDLAAIKTYLKSLKNKIKAQGDQK